jgi:hypothetical protein
MHTLLRLTICSLALLVAGAGLDLAYPGGVVNFSYDLWSLPRLHSSIHDEVEKTAWLQDCCNESLARIEAKRRVVDDVVAGRMSLVEAAKSLRVLREAAPENVKRYAKFKFDASAGVRQSCLMVIAYVKGELATSPDLATAVEGRLRAELCQELGCQACGGY